MKVKRINKSHVTEITSNWVPPVTPRLYIRILQLPLTGSLTEMIHGFIHVFVLFLRRIEPVMTGLCFQLSQTQHDESM